MEKNRFFEFNESILKIQCKDNERIDVFSIISYSKVQCILNKSSNQK